MGYTNVHYHMIFDVKIDFRRKFKLIDGGHMSNHPAESTYMVVVSRERVRIAMIIDALNDIDSFAVDIQNV